MRAIRKFPLLLATSIMLVLALNGAAQQPKVLAPHRPINPRVPDSRIQHPAVERSLVGGFWMIDANRKATIYLKNSMDTSPLTVAPILYLSNGARYSLTPVAIEPSGTAVVSINDALEKQGIAPYSTLSGYLEVQYMWAWDPICATVVTRPLPDPDSSGTTGNPDFHGDSLFNTERERHDTNSSRPVEYWGDVHSRRKLHEQQHPGGHNRRQQRLRERSCCWLLQLHWNW